MQGTDRKLQTGRYVLSPRYSLPQILEKLSQGDTSWVTFTVPEGYNLRQIAALLATQGLATEEDFWEAATKGDFSYPFLAGAPPGKNRLEGFLFPDTYCVAPGTSAEKIINLFLRRFAEVYAVYAARAEEAGLTPLEVVTLASLVEKEAKCDAERPLVAAVFRNRLQRQMPLESCATVQYLLDKPKERLTRANLALPSLYNTYLHPGLPPGPIASPGKASLEAVLSPAPVPYLYFVARSDGTHIFSKTFQEHLAAKASLRPKEAGD